MKCSKCQKDLRENEKVVEIISGVIVDDTVVANESHDVLCQECEEEVMPLLYDSIYKGGKFQKYG